MEVAMLRQVWILKRGNMNKKSNYFSVFYLFCVTLLLGFSLLNVAPQKEEKRSLIESQIEMLLVKESFILKGERRSQFVTHLLAVSKDHEFDPLLILAIMKVESSFNPHAISNRGALGLLQLKPVAAKEVSNFFDLSPVSAKQLMDPFINVQFGVHYLSFLKKSVGKNWMRILAAYNAGPTYIKRTGIVPTGYASKVLRTYRQIIKQVGSV